MLSTPLAVKKVKRAILRLFQSIEMIPDFGHQPSIEEIARDVTQKAYLYQSQKAAIEKAISAKTVAEFLLTGLTELPEEYCADACLVLYKEIIGKVSRRKDKNGVWKGLNRVLILAGKTIESMKTELDGEMRRDEARRVVGKVLRRNAVVKLGEV